MRTANSPAGRWSAPPTADHDGRGGVTDDESGDVAAAEVEFCAWYEAESLRVRTVLSGACGDAALAEEATAEAFARAYARWHSVRRKESPTAWVYSVALNEIRSRVRRRRLERRYLARQRETDQPPPQEPQTELWAAVRQLAPRARTAIALRYVADLSEAQVAAAMGISVGAAASTLSRARRRLAELLEAGESPDQHGAGDQHSTRGGPR